MAKFRMKPVIVEAVQLRWDTWSEMCDFMGVGELTNGKPEGRQDGEHIGLDIPTLEGFIHAEENDWIIKDVEEKIYISHKPGEFEAIYELIKE